MPRMSLVFSRKAAGRLLGRGRSTQGATGIHKESSNLDCVEVLDLQTLFKLKDVSPFLERPGKNSKLQQLNFHCNVSKLRMNCGWRLVFKL
jgi:hypothetical protein